MKLKFALTFFVCLGVSVGRADELSGNLGEPMLDLLDPEVDLYVLELSSFQLETAHALKFYDFLLSRDGHIELKSVSQPEVKFSSPLEAFEQVLAHEQYITGRIHELYDLATTNRDYPLQTLLHWFIDEQVEEEDSARAVIDTLRLIGDSSSNLFLLDRELGARQGGEEE